MIRSVPEKIGVKKGMRSVFVNAPADATSVITSPLLDVKARVAGRFDYIHLFVASQAQFHKKFPKLVEHLEKTGMLWVSWPKVVYKQTDLNIKIVIKLGYDYGLVESKAISINETWSALKFTWPKAGKEYNNSYGKLKD